MRNITLVLVMIFGISPVISYAENVDEKAQAQFTQGELEQMLAPIALYPDSVLTHILIASTYPLEVIEANRWVTKNPDIAAADALAAVETEEWDPSVKALIPFPRILERLSDDLKWTQKLGDAFLQDEERVLASIQALRQRADQAGNLDKMENMVITREDKNIIIQPVEREVIYVPYYDTRVVYGTWHYSDYQPIYWDWSWHQHHHHYGYHYRPHHGLFSWHFATHVSSHYYWSAFNWHNHHVIVVDHHNYNSRRYRHREHIIADSNSRRWTHNPKHRRGVAYRTPHMSERFNSIRPSVNETRVIRNNERNTISNRQTNTNRIGSSREDNQRSSRQDISSQVNIRNNNERNSNDRNNNRQDIELTTSNRNEISRQERLRQQLNDRTQVIKQPSIIDRSSNDRSLNESSSNDRTIINSNNRMIQTGKENQQTRRVDNNDIYRPTQTEVQTNQTETRQVEQSPRQANPRPKRESKPKATETRRDDRRDSSSSSSNYRQRSNRSSQRKD